MTDNAHRLRLKGSSSWRVGMCGMVYQGVYALTQCIALGMLVRYFGREQFGLWMTILALTTWVPAAILGQAAVLLTRLSAVAHSDQCEARRIFSASLLIVCSTAVVLLLALAVADHVVDWGQLLNANALVTKAEVAEATKAAMTVSILCLPSVLVGYAVFARQRGDITHIVMSAGSIVALGAVAISIWLRQPLWVVGGLMLSGPIVSGLTLCVMGITTGLMPYPGWSAVDRATLTGLLHAGCIFCLSDFVTLLIQRTPDLIVAHLHGMHAVAHFATVGRLPLMSIALFQALLVPFWPAIGEAAHRKDYGSVRHIVRRTLILVLALAVLVAVGIRVLGSYFVYLWMGSVDFAEPDLIAAACAQSLGLGVFSWLVVLLSALSQQRLVLGMAALTAVVFLPLSLLCGQWFGPVGVAAAQAGTLLFVTTPLGCFLLYHLLAKTRPRIRLGHTI